MCIWLWTWWAGKHLSLRLEQHYKRCSFPQPSDYPFELRTLPTHSYPESFHRKPPSQKHYIPLVCGLGPCPGACDVQTTLPLIFRKSSDENHQLPSWVAGHTVSKFRIPVGRAMAISHTRKLTMPSIFLQASLAMTLPSDTPSRSSGNRAGRRPPFRPYDGQSACRKPTWRCWLLCPGVQSH